MKDFWAMGGYGLYVWTSYAIAFVVFLGLFVQSGLCLSKVKAMIKRRIRRESTN